MSNADTMFQQALSAYQANNFAEAETLFLKILELEPFSSESMLNLGNVYHQTGKIEKAVEKWQRAIEVNPMEDKAYLNLGNHFFSVDKPRQAIYYWEIFASIHKDHPTVHYNLGMAYENLKEMRNSVVEYTNFLHAKRGGPEHRQVKRRIRIAENVALHNVKLAERAMKRGNLQKAKEGYERSVCLFPLHPNMYKHYASVLYQLGNYADAYKWYELAYREIPADVTIILNMAIASEKQNKMFMALWGYTIVVKKFAKRLPDKVKRRYQTLLQTDGDRLCEEAYQQIQDYVKSREFHLAEEMAKRLMEIWGHAAPQKAKDFKDFFISLDDKRFPQRLAGNIALGHAEDYDGKGELDRALPFYQRYLDLLPNGQRAKEIKKRLEEIRDQLYIPDEEFPMDAENPMLAAISAA